MLKNFYQLREYRQKQSQLTKKNWRKGTFDFLQKKVIRVCVRSGCKSNFTTIPSDPKKYCSSSCGALVSNVGRTHSLETRRKIKLALTGRKYPSRKKAPAYSICKNQECRKEFELRYWTPKNNPTKYCSRLCSIKDTGRRPTSPKAARAVAGIRADINDHNYFFSRREANFARIMDLLKIRWIHQPRVFKLRKQNYTPDFYLPDYLVYIEIKNFLSFYSKNRDEQFRELYPRIELVLILKIDYLKLQNIFSPLIRNWELPTKKKLFTQKMKHDKLQHYRREFFEILQLPM